MNKIGNILKSQRIKKNLTLEALSDISSISISTLSKIENDKIENINSVFLYRLCNILKLDYNNMLRQRWEIFPTFFYGRKSSIASK